MPNWAYGHTDITGTKDAILSFVNRFIFPDEPKTVDGVKYSASTCVESGYPDLWPDNCITLQTACTEDQVDVSIHTKEDGMWFEEYLWCFRTGESGSECNDLQTAVCKDCGNTQAIASFEDLDDLVCYECGESNFEMAKEDQ